MVKFVSGRPILPAPPRGLPVEIVSWAASLHRVLTGLMTETNTAVNQLISREGRPAFAAYLGTEQTGVTQATWTTVDIDTEDYDTDDAFSTSTSKFTPLEPGKYLLVGAARFAALSDGVLTAVGVLKNGTDRKDGVTMRTGAAGDGAATIAVIVDADGVDDFFELQAFQDDSASETIDDGAAITWFQGFRIGP